MKKVLVLILCLSMMVGLTACNNSNDVKDNNDKSEEKKVSQETEEDKETDETEEEKETKETQTEKTEEVIENSGVEFAPSPYTQRTPYIAIEVPKGYNSTERGYTQMFIAGWNSISLVTHKKHTPISLEDAHDAAFEKYIQGFQNYGVIDTLTVEKEEVIEINGREMYHFEGKINCIESKEDYSLYCTGYSFVMDDIPCMLIGTVIEKEQPQEMVDEVKMYTDAMIQTVRSRDEE